MRNPVSITIIALILWIAASSCIYVYIIRDHRAQSSETEETIMPLTEPEPAIDSTVVSEPGPIPDPVADANKYLYEKEPQFIHFEFAKNQTGIPDELQQYTDQLRIFLEGTPGSKVYVTGHTDNIGTDEANNLLSRQRAAFVGDYLVKNGIQRPAIVEEGKGETEPVASNDTEEGRAKNRRVEIRINK